MLYLFASAVAEESEAAEAKPGFFETVFKKLTELPATVWIALGVLAALGIILLAVSKNRRVLSAKVISFGALSVALSFVLSCIRLYRMPQGGSVTPGSMLPVLFFSAGFGVVPGLIAGLIDGLLQYLEGGWFLNVWQVLLDYFLAYAALGLGGLYRAFVKSSAFKKSSRYGGLLAFYAAMFVALLFRGLSATLAGYVFWDTAFWPSVVYNCTYLLPEFAVCCVLAIPLFKPVMQVMKH